MADGAGPVAGPVAGRVRDAAGRLLDGLGRAEPGPGLGAVAAARDLSAVADEAMQLAVDRARAAGHSWREIGDVLQTTRQAAFQRFGRPADPRTGQPVRRDVPPILAGRAAAITGSLAAGRWEEARAGFDDRMRERVDAARLAGAWASTLSLIGQFERAGEPAAYRVTDDLVVVDTPLYFEAGERMARVTFGPDGRVAGLFLRPHGA